MKLSVSIEIAGPSNAVLEYLNSDEYLAEASKAEGILRAEREEQTAQGDTLVVATRWYAPTKLPSILKKYEGKAPESVNWLEKMTWNLSTLTAELTVRPDVPESWHSKYKSSGMVRLDAIPGGTRLTQDLEFSMDFGLIGKALERLLKNEIETLLQRRLDVLSDHFS